LGDVVLTLPLCIAIRQRWPGVQIVFLCRSYAAPVVACCSAVDQIVRWDELEQQPETAQLAALKALNIRIALHVFPVRAIARRVHQAGIAHRVGTRSRWYHWLTCNPLVNLHRKNSPLHESELNLQLARAVLDLPQWTRAELQALQLLDRVPQPPVLAQHLDGRYRVVLHAKSSNSAREWPMERWVNLARSLPAERFQLIVTGTAAEAEALAPLRRVVNELPGGLDTVGKLSLTELLGFIAQCDALVACSTGPLHLAAGLGKQAIGLYPPIRPMHPGRWAPLGSRSAVLVSPTDCNDCRKPGTPCRCMQQLETVQVAQLLTRGVDGLT
jgi:ADP-heptose:LPS heptosyltransferase